MPGDRLTWVSSQGGLGFGPRKVAANAPNRIWWLLNIWLFPQMATILGLVGPLARCLSR